MDGILIKVLVILALVGVLALIAYDDRRSRRIREEEDRAKRRDQGS